MSTELIKTEEVANIVTSFPAIMAKNSKSLESCTNAGKTLLDTIEAEGMNEQIDQSVAEYLGKVSTLISNMQARRQPITQLFDRIRSFFTSQEKSIDSKIQGTIPAMLVAKRNEYAALKHRQEQERKREAERLANIERERVYYQSQIEEAVSRSFNTYLTSRLSELASIFTSMSLATYGRDTNRILLFSTEYPKSQFDALSSVQTSPTYYLTPEAKRTISTSVLSGKYEQLAATFTSRVKEAKQNYSDQFVSKQRELEEIEELRKTNEQAALQAEQDRIKRELEQAAASAAEVQRNQEVERQRIATQEQTQTMQSLFATAAATVSAPPANAKIKEKIKVLHTAGFLEVYQMWWTGEGQSLTIEELEKIHKKMITYCEKQANSKDPQHISSTFIRYDEEIKAK
ncbi:MAG: hypothetical protein RR711_11755 [Bacteroides sp.]